MKDKTLQGIKLLTMYRDTMCHYSDVRSALYGIEPVVAWQCYIVSSRLTLLPWLRDQPYKPC